MYIMYDIHVLKTQMWHLREPNDAVGEFVINFIFKSYFKTEVTARKCISMTSSSKMHPQQLSSLRNGSLIDKSHVWSSLQIFGQLVNIHQQDSLFCLVPTPSLYRDDQHSVVACVSNWFKKWIFFLYDLSQHLFQGFLIHGTIDGIFFIGQTMMITCGCTPDIINIHHSLK